MKEKALLLVNFGGPRNPPEIAPFLKELLTDRDVVRTNLPSFVNHLLFSWVAKKRARKIAHDYDSIGGNSPIFADTEKIASELEKRLSAPVLTFHRYLPATHKQSLAAIEACNAKEIIVLPLFPQFSYATTGSIARFLANHLCCRTTFKLRWIPSYPDHPCFIASWTKQIARTIDEKKMNHPFLLFSAHGVPQAFICTDDPYQTECVRSFEAISRFFPKSSKLLAYQSKFGKGQWLSPSTEEICRSFDFGSHKEILIIPLTFTTDHIETLFEIEQQYIPLLQERGFSAVRCPALNLNTEWLDALTNIAQANNLAATSMLVRHREIAFCCSGMP